MAASPGRERSRENARTRVLDSRRKLLVAASILVGVGGLATAVSAWGGVGMAIGVAGLAAILVAAFVSARRSEAMYLTKTRARGTPVFAALLNGSKGGDLLVTDSGLVFERNRRRPVRLSWEWSDVAQLVVRRKGPWGSAGVLRIHPQGGSASITIEVVDVERVDRSLAAVPELASKLDRQI